MPATLPLHESDAPLRELFTRRIALLDGAMGTMIQRHPLTEADFRGERFKDHGHDLKGNNDLLSITRPDVIKGIHRAYFKAGSDIVETNTFSTTTVSQADYGLEDAVREINLAGAGVAREAADEFMAANPGKRVFVAGSVGPTNRTASMSPDVNNPGYRAVTFDGLVVSYSEQIEALLDGGVDLLLLETVFDTLNLKAAIFACEEVFERRGMRWPIILSVTITDASGRTLSGQTVEAFWNSVRHSKPLAVGINCALGASEMRPYIEELSRIADCYISCYPNAGLPNAFDPSARHPPERTRGTHDRQGHLLHDGRRADECDRLAEVLQADHCRGLRDGALRGASAGGERGEYSRCECRRGNARQRGGHGDLPSSPGGRP